MTYKAIRTHEADEDKPVLIFDYDGTLQETLKIYGPAVLETCKWLREDPRVQESGVKVKDPDEDTICSWLGVNAMDMWDEFLPDLPRDIQLEGSDKIGEEMEELVRDGAASWYDGAEEMLDELHDRGYEMYILSNCQKSYAETHMKTFKMDRWFKDFIDCESYGYAPKSEIVKELADKLGHRNFIGIGDRAGDMKGVHAVGGKFIGCTYGYAHPGELDNADAFAKSPTDILEYLPG